MQRRFTVRVAQYADSGWVLGAVVELPGCCTRAPDLDTLREKIVEAIQVYLETFENRAPIQPFETYQVVKVSKTAPSLHQRERLSLPGGVEVCYRGGQPVFLRCHNW